MRQVLTHEAWRAGTHLAGFLGWFLPCSPGEENASKSPKITVVKREENAPRNEETEKKTRRRGYRWRLAVCVLAAGPLLLTAGLVAILALPRVQDWLSGQAVARLSSLLDANIRLQSLRLHLLEGTLDAKGLEILGKGERSGTSISLEAATARIRWAALFGGRVELTGVSARKLGARLLLDEKGHLVLPFKIAESEPKNEPGEPIDLRIERARLSEGWLELSEKGQAGRRIDLTSVELDMNLHVRGQVTRGTLTIGEIRVSAKDQEPLAGTSFTASWALAGGTGTLDSRLAGKEAGMTLDLSSQLRDLNNQPRYTARISGFGDLAPLSRRFVPDLSIAGTFKLDFTAAGSSSGLPNVDGSVRFSQLSARGRTLDAVTVTARSEGGLLEAGNLEIKDPAGTARVDLRGKFHPSLGDIAFTGSLENVDLEHFAGQRPPGPRLRSLLGGSFEGTLKDPSLPGTSVKAQLKLVPMARKGTFDVAPDLTAKVRLSEGSVFLDEFAFKERGTRAEARGSYGIEKAVFTGEVALEAPDIGPYLALAGVKGRGSIRSHLKGSGSFERPALAGELHARSLVAGAAAIDCLDMEARMTGRDVVVSHASVQAYEAEAVMDAEGSLPGAAGGRSDIELNVKGIRYRGVRFSGLTGSAAIGNRIEARLKTTDQRIEAEYEKPPKGPARARASIHEFDLGILGSFLPAQFADLAGQVSAEAEAVLAPNHDPDVDLNVKTLELRTSGRTITTENARIRSRGSLVEVAKCDLRADDQSVVSFSGLGMLDGSRLDLNVLIDVPDLSSWQKFFPGEEKVAGRISARARIGGSVDRPHGTATMSATQLKYGDAGIDSADLVLEPAEDSELAARLRVEGAHKSEIKLPVMELTAKMARESVLLAASTFGGQLQASATVALNRPWPLTAEVGLKSLDIALLSKLDGKDRGVSGSVAGNVMVKGTLENLRGLAVETRIDTLDIGNAEIRVASAEAIRCSYHDERVTVESLRLSGSGLSLSVSGSLPLEGRSANRMEVAGDVRLNALLPFVAALDRARGRVSARLTVAGSLAEPNVTGTLEIKDGLLDGPAFPAPVEKLAGSATFSADAITVNAVSAKFAEGTLSGEAAVSLKNQKLDHLNATLKMRDVDLEVIKDMEFRGSGDLSLSGRWPNILAKGQIRVEDLTYVPSIDVMGLLKAFTEKRIQKAPPAREEGSLNAELDIAVIASDAIHVEGSLADAEFGGNLQIKGLAQSPVILGTVAANRGSFNLLGSRYDLSRARIDFQDPLNVDPDLDITGTTSKAGDVITVKIQGRASKAQLTFSSSMGRSQADIMALLTGISGTGSSSQGTLADSAARMALKGAASPLLGMLGAQTDLEIVPLPTTPEGEEFLFSVSKGLGGGVSATYFKGQSGETADALEFRWRLSSRTNGRIRQNQDGTLSGGFRIRREFN